MKAKLTAMIIMALGVTIAQAEEEPKEICFEWTKNADVDGQDGNNVDGYRIYRDPSTNKQFIFPDMVENDVLCPPGKKCSICVPNIADGMNHRYVLVAYNSFGESDFSTAVDVIIPTPKTPVDPVGQSPDSPGATFTITIPPIEVKVTQ